MDKTPKVLFLSRGNASRGQMAEGFLRALAGDRFIPFSAGTEASSVSPLAFEVMCEAGVDISGQKPREVISLFRETFQYVVVLCDAPVERYPIFPFTRNLLKWPVPNPDIATGEAELKKQVFRKVRDQMRGNVEELIETMNERESAFARSRSAAA